MEVRLRTPFLLDMENEIANLSDLIFALQGENVARLKPFTEEVTKLRAQVIMGREYLSRTALAKMLIPLLANTAKEGATRTLFSLTKNPNFKTEMEKPAFFNTRQQMNLLLPNERKPNFQQNFSSIKRFYMTHMGKKEEKKPEANSAKSQRGRSRGGRGRGRPYGFQNDGGYYHRQNQQTMIPQNYVDPSWRNNQGGRVDKQLTKQERQKQIDMQWNNCFYCHKPGHIMAQCQKRENKNNERTAKNKN